MMQDDRCFSPELWDRRDVFPTNQTILKHLHKKQCNCTVITQLHNLSDVLCEVYPFDLPWYSYTVFISLFAVIITLSVVGNSTVVWVVLAHKRMRTITNYFLLNLAISDISISILNTSFSFIQNLYYNWFFGDYFCPVFLLTGITPTCSSVFTLIAMSIDRWWGLTRPFARRLNRASTLCTIGFIWLASIACGAPYALLYQTSTVLIFDDKTGKITRWNSCKEQFCSEKLCKAQTYYAYFLLTVQYLIPVVVLVCTYTSIAMVLWGSTHVGEHVNQEQVQAKRKIVKMMAVVFVAFLVLWLPYHLWYAFLSGVLGPALGDVKAMMQMYAGIHWLAMSSTCINPIIYCWMNERFRTGFKWVFRWLPFCVHITKQEYLTSDLSKDNARRCANALINALHQSDGRGSTSEAGFQTIMSAKRGATVKRSEYEIRENKRRLNSLYGNDTNANDVAKNNSNAAEQEKKNVAEVPLLQKKNSNAVTILPNKKLTNCTHGSAMETPQRKESSNCISAFQTIVSEPMIDSSNAALNFAQLNTSQSNLWKAEI